MKVVLITISLLILSQVIYAKDVDTQLAESRIKASTGRVISVFTFVDDFNHEQRIVVKNFCSATLIAANEILLAGHCFKIKHILPEKYKKRFPNYFARADVEYYFDIDGVTSKDLGAQLDTIQSDQSENDWDDFRSDMSISKKSSIKNLVRNLPRIENIKIHKKYSQSPLKDFSLYLSVTFDALKSANKYIPDSTFDIAKAKLDRNVSESFIKISDYRLNEIAYTAGYEGGYLNTELAIQKCTTGEAAYNSATRIGYEGRSQSRLKNNLKKVVRSSILLDCPDGVIRGQSGGPIVVVRNSEVFVVGVNSAAPDRTTTLVGARAIRANDIK